MKCPRRFCCQQDSFSSPQTGCSLPLLMTVSRVPATPRLTKYSLTALARRAPSARLYSALPRESQCPSIVEAVLPHFLSQSASRCSGGLASSRSSALSRSKYTSWSGRSAFNCSSDFCAKICSSVSALGRGAGAGAGGGDGGGGGAGVTAGGGGGAGAGGETFL